MNFLVFLSKFYHLNPRWLYLAVTVVLLIPLLWDLPMPSTKGSKGSKLLYQLVSECPSNKVILIDSSWDLGSKPECWSQLECFVNDLCKRKIKFVTMSTGLYAPTFVQQVVVPITEKAGYVYGTDWVNLGFIQPPAGNWGVLIDAFCRDIHKTRPVDNNSTPVKDIPLMQQVTSVSNLHMVFAINYCPPMEWMSFGKSQYGLPVAFGSAAIMGPYYYNFVESGQMSGLLAGNRGAYEYEALTGITGMGSKVMMAFAFAMCFMISAVLLGNLGFWATVRLRRNA